MKITVEKWLNRHSYNPSEEGLVVFVGRLLIPRSTWSNVLVSDSARLIVRRE